MTVEEKELVRQEIFNYLKGNFRLNRDTVYNGRDEVTGYNYRGEIRNPVNGQWEEVELYY